MVSSVLNQLDFGQAGHTAMEDEKVHSHVHIDWICIHHQGGVHSTSQMTSYNLKCAILKKVT